MLPKMPERDENDEEVGSPDTSDRPRRQSSHGMNSAIACMGHASCTRVLDKLLISTGRLVAYSASDGSEIALIFQAHHL